MRRRSTVEEGFVLLDPTDVGWTVVPGEMPRMPGAYPIDWEGFQRRLDDEGGLPILARVLPKH